MMLEVYDWLFHLVHILVIVINSTFWMSFRTLKISQMTLLSTLVSWLGFGFFYGFGYCFLTDWHWQLKHQMGDVNLPPSYIKLVLDRTFRQDFDANLIDKMTIMILLVSIVGCTIQTLRYYRHSR
jgi:hypothetical protein